ncbi:helix-turn-helix transcriptional regulator [Microbacterium alcoholitolerans]|uniref:helix-turn-helix transcriptional regulator n=1 Tax=unclassified Microbacterium TaxID=2609290 RepID=UPI003D1707EB
MTTVSPRDSSINGGVLPDAPVPEIDRSCVSRLAKAVEIADYAAAEEIARDSWFDLALSLRHGVAEALEPIPANELRGRPLLLMMLGMAYNVTPQQRAKGLRYFVAAVFAARSMRGRVRMTDRVLLLASESAAFRVIGRTGLSVRAARSALGALEALPAVERGSIPALPRIYAHLGTSLYYGGRVAEALSCFERGLAESPTQGYPLGFTNVAMLAGIHALAGDVHEAEAYLQSARGEPWTDVQRSWYSGTFYRIAEAIVALERFDTATARAHLDAMRHDRRTIEHWRAISATEALVALVDGRAAAGLVGMDAFAKLRGEEGRRPATVSSLAGVRSLLQLALGSTAAAATVLRSIDRGEAERYAGAARIALARGEHGAALHDSRVAAERACSSRTLAEAAAIEAAATLRVEGSRRRRPAIEHLAELLLSTGMRLPVTMLPPADYAAVCAELTRFGYDELRQELPERPILTFDAPEAVLTEAELTVLDAMRRHPSITSIAGDLRLSVNTVKSHRRNIYRKLQVNTRDAAVAVGLDRQLLISTE